MMITPLSLSLAIDAPSATYDLIEGTPRCGEIFLPFTEVGNLLWDISDFRDSLVWALQLIKRKCTVGDIPTLRQHPNTRVY